MNRFQQTHLLFFFPILISPLSYEQFPPFHLPETEFPDKSMILYVVV